MNWDDLRFVLAMARYANAVTAGKKLGVASTTVTRRIAALEGMLDQTLFRRTRQGMRPTEAGLTIVKLAERIEAEIDQAQRVSLSPDNSVSGTVKLATTEALSAFLCDRGLLTLTVEYPNLRIEMLAGNLTVDLHAGQADLALRVIAPREANLRVKKLGELALVLCAAPAYIAKYGAPVNKEILAGHRIVVPSGELAVLPEAQWLTKQQGTIVVLKTNSFPTLISAVRSGAGISILPESWMAQTDGIDSLGLLPELPTRTLYLVRSAQSANRRAVKVVADFISAVFASVVKK